MKYQTKLDHLVAVQTERVVNEAAPWIERLGRIGYAARGVVYALVGWFAALAATGLGGGMTDKPGALRWLKSAPFGQILLVAITVGLAGLALWRFIQALRDTEHKGSDWKGIAIRSGFFFIGLIEAMLAWTGLRLLLMVGRDRLSPNWQKSWTLWLLSQPFGPVLVFLVGLAFIGTGFYQWYKAFTAKFGEPLAKKEMSEAEEKWMRRAGRAGFATMGVVLCITGSFFVLAAIRFDPRQSFGLGGALKELYRQPYGPWLLGVTAGGLIAYGIFSFMLARYRRMRVR